MPDFQTRTLLFSDIEGSTRLQIATGDEYPDILATHRKLIRDAVSANNGIEHRTAGDGFFFVFNSARDGLMAAIDAQRGLRAHAWPHGQEVRVRMGLHAGEVGASDDDVVGLAINEASRIMDAAHGGQVLVSTVVRDLTAGALPSGVSLRTLGPHRLKDFDEPVELLQARHPDLPESLLPPRTRDQTLALPVPRTSFVGRERELTQVVSLLQSGRHVTLTGVGGSGKTRLALEAASSQVATYPDGLFFVDLAPLADPTQVIGAIAASVSVKGDTTADIEDLLLSYLASRRVLILLDNCEHLVDAAADACDLILERCPGVTILATSREALQLDGEQSFNVRSMRVDNEDSEGVQLFVARARGVRPDFKIDREIREDVLAICERLDGIPLAIELAAARVDHMSVSDIAKRLDDRFELLVGGRRRRAQRQQTLQAAMDWSWTLLTDEERRVLRALAVFAGPFPLEAAEAVSGVRPTLNVLRSLVSKSLVDVVAGPTTMYRLLETVRLYSQERLVEAGEAPERRDAHRDWYLERVESVPLDRYNDMREVDVAIRDHPNVRAALDWALDQGRRDLVGRLVVSVATLWIASQGHLEEARRWLFVVGDDESQPVAIRAHAFQILATAAILMGRLSEVRAFVDRSIELDSSERPVLSVVYWLAGRSRDSIELAERFEMPVFTRYVRAWDACLRFGADPVGVLPELDAVVRELDPDTRSWDTSFSVMGACLARILVGEADTALRMVREIGEGWDISAYEAWFGSLARYPDVVESLALATLGHYEESRALAADVSRAALRDRYPLLPHDCLTVYAYIAFREADLDEAARLLEPVVRDTRLRMAPMFSFVGRFLAELRHALTERGDEPDLPRTREFVNTATAIFGGGANPDDRSEQIERMLREVVDA